MFAKIFESDPPRYYLPSEQGGIPNGIGLQSNYAPYLVTPPRIYAEELQQPTPFLIGAFTRKERTPYSDFSIHLMAAVYMIYYPGYAFRHWWFDGATGAYLGRDDYVSNELFTVQVVQARDGGLWTFTGDFYEVDELTYDPVSGTTYTPADFGATLISKPPLVDRATDLVVMHSNLEASNQIGVYTLSTGALVRRIEISGAPAQIFPEDAKRCYIVTTDYMLNLVDYTTGAVISALRAPGIEAGALGHLFAWDRFLRRILVFVQRFNATDGACLSTFSGFYPVPKSVGMTAPIPLRAPRAGRRTPFMCKIYGDAGEGIPGVRIWPVTVTSDVIGAPPFTDSDGEAIITLRPDAAGSDTLVVTADASLTGGVGDTVGGAVDPPVGGGDTGGDTAGPPESSDGGPSVSLSWSASIPSSGASIVGYRVYWGTTMGNYTRTINFGNVTSGVVNSGLTDGTMYYFVVTAIDSAGRESWASGPQQVWVPIKSRTFHVAKTGSNSNPGTAAQPWLTIQKAHDTATTPGSTIIVHAGTYSERIVFSHGGNADGARINYQAAYGETVSLDFRPLSLWPQYSGGWQIPAAAKYLTFDGFHVFGKSSNGTDNYGFSFSIDTTEYITFKNMEFSLGGSGLNAYVSTNVRIWDCYFHHNEGRGFWNSGNSASNDNWDVRRVTSYGNNYGSFYDPSHSNTDGFNLQDMDFVLAEDCVCYGANPGTAPPTNSNYQYDGLDMGAASSAPGMKRVIVRRCVSHDNANTNYPNSTTITGPVVFQYCQSYACNSGTGWGGCVTYEGSLNVDYWNCTHDDVSTGINYNEPGAGTLKVRNNIFNIRSSGNIAMNRTGGTAGNFDTNYNRKSTTGNWGATPGASDSVGSLGFADAAFQTSRDYRLASSSPCVSAGTFMTTTSSSGSGVSVIPCTSDPSRHFRAGDQIQVGNSLVWVSAVSTSQITIFGTVSFANGAGVHLPWGDGAAPDQGALPFTLRPSRVVGMTVSNVTVP